MVQVNKKTLNIRGKLLDLSTPVAMGILNLTSDSFYAESRAGNSEQIVEMAGKMIEEGAKIVDIGGYSTRPGAKEIDISKEMEKVEAALDPLVKYFPNLVISIDTFRSQVAAMAVGKGASLINDVSGGTLDDLMFKVTADLKVPYILMHMRGTPQTMNQMTSYNQLVPDILKDLQNKILALKALGVADVIIDPGFGFAKTISQNFELIQNLNAFNLLGYPLLVGISRKTTIYKTLDISANEALNGTTVLNIMALQQGVSILRVHDVRPAVEAIKLWNAAGRCMN
ncbi:dihydropteroate synthase [Dyadobacter arcticus]|uniref:dihydropteroate synthase n=1 Tax=Dyadobacter arcticus TaxID=1078754 RepID=A0ABX0UPU0_9BACT|nr:dihydropteroate synthase [Dyadobacter arcticus]NIJ53695.1 dihydropteroate synthase [Dyadobacter arcticus]